MAMFPLRILLTSKFIHNTISCVFVLYTVCYMRYEMSELTGSTIKGVSITTITNAAAADDDYEVIKHEPVEDVSIATSTNAAYEIMKQRPVASDEYEIVDAPRGGVTVAANQEITSYYEIRSIPQPQSSSHDTKSSSKSGQEGEGALYEVIQ